MLALTHTVIGASAGSKIGNPYLAFISGVLLHFLFDKFPHFWPSKKVVALIYLRVDWLISFIIILFFLSSNYVNNTGIIGGAIGGFIVDIVLISIPGIRESKVSKWHTERQPHKSKPLYFFIDFVFIIITLTILGYSL